MEDATVAPDQAGAQDGERAQLQGAAFWKAHEARRVEQGLSVAA